LSWLEEAIELKLVVRQQVLIDPIDHVDQVDRIDRDGTIEERLQVGVRFSLVASHFAGRLPLR
jgi:hypothetical protein